MRTGYRCRSVRHPRKTVRQVPQELGLLLATGSRGSDCERRPSSRESRSTTIAETIVPECERSMMWMDRWQRPNKTSPDAHEESAGSSAIASVSVSVGGALSQSCATASQSIGRVTFNVQTSQKSGSFDLG